MLAAAFGGLFIGKLLDKHGPRLILAVAGTVSALAIMSLEFFHPAWWFIGVFVITGLVGVQGQAPSTQAPPYQSGLFVNGQRRWASSQWPLRWG